jgi:hypothetical protein
MVFGNMVNVKRLTGEYPQSPIFAMRLSKALPALDITARTGLKLDEVKRFNPRWICESRRRRTCICPFYVQAFGNRRLVLASSTDAGIRCGAQRLPACRGRYRAVARGII